MPIWSLTSRIRIGMRVLNSTVYLVSIWCLFLLRPRENYGDWREPIEMRGSQYSCRFQRMLLCWRELAKGGGAESLTLRHHFPYLFIFLICNNLNFPI